MVGGVEEEGLRRRRSRVGRPAANKLPEPLSGVSRVCRHQRVFGFDFHGTSSSPEKASSKGTRDTCRRESHSDVTARRTMQTRADEGHGEGQRGDDGQVVAEAGADGAPVDFAFRVREAVDGAVRVLGDARQELVGRREGGRFGHGRGPARGLCSGLRRRAARASAGGSLRGF